MQDTSAGKRELTTHWYSIAKIKLYLQLEAERIFTFDNQYIQCFLLLINRVLFTIMRTLTF